MTIRILFVEDDDDLAQRLASGLAQAGFAVERADNGVDGRSLGVDQDFDAAILDLGLPELQGLDVLKAWRAHGRRMPVLILTSRGSWSEKVDGLNAGADDYLTKPFHMPEVVARLRALIRRSAGIVNAVIAHKGLTFDPSTGRVTADDQTVELTAREIRLLNVLLHRLGRIVSQSELTDHLYTLDESRDSNTIEVYVSRLRKKIGAHRITTVRGLGYRMD